MKITLFVMLAYFIQFLIYDGLGLIFISLFFRNIKNTPTTHRLFLGLFFLVTLLSILHLFIPIDAFVAYPLAGIAISYKFYCALNDFLKRKLILNTSWKKRVSYFAIFFLSISITINGIDNSTLSPYDAGLYHFQVTKWISEMSIVPGLGNLHGRLSFNNTWFYGVSFFQSIFSQGYSHYLLVSFWYLVLLLYLFFIVTNTIWKKRKIFLFSLAVVQIYLLIHSPLFLVSISPDSINYYISLFLLTELFIYINGNPTAYFKTFNLFFAALLLSIKVISILVFFPFILVFFKFQSNLRLYRNHGRIILIICSLFGLLYCIRGFILSGYFSYPIAFPMLDVEWKIPLSTLEHATREVRGWARNPGAGYLDSLKQPFTVWAKYWWGLHKNETIVRLLVICFSSSFISASLFFLQWKQNRMQIGFAGILLSIGIVFWFFNAPDPRFIFGLIIFCIAYNFSIWFLFLEGKFDLRILKVALLIAAIYLANGRVKFAPIRESEFNKVPVAKVYYRKIHSGIIYMPVDSEQCWESPLPCMPNHNPNIKFRGESLSDGFKLK